MPDPVPPLAFPFTRDHFRHDLLERSGMVCLIERTNLLTNSIHFEVVRLLHEPARDWPDGRFTPAHLRYPGNEEWGSYGWSYISRPEAEQKYRSLVVEQAEKGGSAGE